MITDLRCHPTNALLEAWHTVYAMLLSNYKWDVPEIHTMEKGYFLKPIIPYQMIEFFVCVFFFSSPNVSHNETFRHRRIHKECTR